MDPDPDARRLNQNRIAGNWCFRQRNSLEMTLGEGRVGVGDPASMASSRRGVHGSLGIYARRFAPTPCGRTQHIARRGAL
jgi:hypothetical protein